MALMPQNCWANMTMAEARTARKFRLIVKSSMRRLRERCSARISSISMHFDVSVPQAWSSTGLKEWSSLSQRLTVKVDSGGKFRLSQTEQTFPRFPMTVLADEPARRLGGEVNLGCGCEENQPWTLY